ncbi:C2 domain-containing protein [Mortierella sp. GBAus27b]|nr:hypothetical protein BGX31_002466 [Mortierella sp. GBA43]KAI8353957.1 C2 domain-containing protein [Mortierella sp. GBAus27b]
MTGHSLYIHVRKATDLKDVERLGKNDPYVVLFINRDDKSSYRKTSTKKNAGSHAEWDEVAVLENYEASRHTELFVRVLDAEKLVDEPIGYNTIPLNQVNDAEHRSYKARFPLFLADGKQKGYIHLTITVIPSEHAGATITNDNAEAEGHAILGEQQQKDIKAKEREEDATQVAAGLALLGGAIAAKSLLGGSKDKKEA